MVFRCESTPAVASIALCSSAVASLLEQPGEAHMVMCTGWVKCNLTVQQLKLC